MNWTGHVAAAPRSDLAGLLKRPEASRTGIYLLLGDDPESTGGSLVYIGEGDDVGKRLYQHARAEDRGGKDFWDRAIILTSKDANLTKAHARYLESHFISLAVQAQRSRLVNGTAPAPLPLPEADVSDMEYFIAQAKIVLPILGVNVLRSAVTTETGAEATAPEVAQLSSPVFVLRLKKDGITAWAREIDGEFTVLEGSHARAAWAGSQHSYKALHEKLAENGVLVPEPGSDTMRFARHQVFASPSAAAAVVTGRQANGRLEWKSESSGLSFGSWQDRDLDQAVGETSLSASHQLLPDPVA